MSFQEMIKQKKIFNFSKSIDAFSVSGKDASKHSTAFSVEALPGSLYRLNCGICLPEHPVSLNEIITTDFVAKTRSSNPFIQKEADKEFKQVIGYVKSNDTRALFATQEYNNALVTSFDFNPSSGYQIVNTTIYNAKMRIDEIAEYQFANNSHNEYRYKEQMVKWKKFVAHQKLGNYRHDMLLPFENIREFTAGMIQDFATTLSLEKNVECLLQDKDDFTNPANSAAYNNRSNIGGPKASQQNWTAQIAQAKSFVAAANRMAFDHYSESITNSVLPKNLLTPEQAQAVAVMASKHRKLVA